MCGTTPLLHAGHYSVSLLLLVFVTPSHQMRRMLLVQDGMSRSCVTVFQFERRAFQYFGVWVYCANLSRHQKDGVAVQFLAWPSF